MERTLRDREILKGIRDLSSKRATGKLQIRTGMTQGAIFFDKGQIVDANLGKLNGFQAINVIASIPDATFDFDPSISPPAQHFNFRERLVLTEAFGLNVQSEPKYSPAVNEPSDDVPATAMLLNAIEEQPGSDVVQVETEPVFDLSSVEPAAVISDTTPLNNDEQPHETYYSNDEIIPDNAPSKWTVLKALFRRKVWREPDYSPAVNELSDDGPATAILLNDVEEQPSSSVVQVETEPVIEQSAVDPAAAVISDTTPLNTAEQPNSIYDSAIFLNNIEDQPTSDVVQVETEQALDLSSVEPTAVTSDTRPLNTIEQPHDTYYSNDEDGITDKAPSKWSALKHLFGRRLQHNPGYSRALNEPSDDVPATAILLNDVEEQPSSGVVQTELAIELSAFDPAAVTSDTTPLNTAEQPQSTYYSKDEDILAASAPTKWTVLKAFFGRKVQREPDYSAVLNELSDDAPATAILLNDIEEQPSSSVVQVETEPVLELSSVDPVAVTSDTSPLTTEEQPQSTYYSKDEDILPDNAPSRWTVLKAFFVRRAQRELEYSPEVNEPSDDAPSPAIFRDDVEDQSNSSVLDAQPIAQLEAEPVLELSSPEYLQALDGPSDNGPVDAIFLNDVEDQPNSGVLDAQRIARLEPEPMFELSSVDPAAVTAIATRLNTDQQLLTSHCSNHEDSIPYDADEVEVISGIAHREDYLPVILYQPGSPREFRPTFVAGVLGILLGGITAVLFYQSRELSLRRAAIVQTSSPANAPATPGVSSDVVSAAPALAGKRVKVSENRQGFTQARRAPIEVKRSILHAKRPVIFRAAPRQEKVGSTLSPSSPSSMSSRSSPSLPSVARQSATPSGEPVFRPAVAQAPAPQPRSDSNVLKRGATESIRGVRFVSSRVGSWVGSVFGKKKRSAQ